MWAGADPANADGAGSQGGRATGGLRRGLRARGGIAVRMPWGLEFATVDVNRTTFEAPPLMMAVPGRISPANSLASCVPVAADSFLIFDGITRDSSCSGVLASVPAQLKLVRVVGRDTAIFLEAGAFRRIEVLDFNCPPSNKLECNIV